MYKDQINPVLISGAGPTGMTAALELSRMGISVKIIDKASGPSATSRALAVQARTIELFEQRGIAHEMLDKGNRAHATTIYSDNKTLAKVDLTLISSRYNFCLLIPQSDTEAILRKQLEKQNVAIEWQTEMTDFIQLPSAKGVIATIKNADGQTETFEASFLIAAEGAHSPTRAKLGVDFHGITMRQNYALGDLHIDGNIPDDELSVFLTRKGFVAVFPLTGQRFRMMATDIAGNKTDQAPSLEYLQKLYDAVVHIPGRLYDVQWTSRFGINSRMVHTLKVGNVFLGGDTAHIHSPAGGQGMNTGIQDMINLCWKLAYYLKGLARAEMLDTYQEERLPIISSLLSTTERATDLLNSTNPIIHGLINTLLPPILSVGMVQKKGAAVVGELSHSYSGSALADQGAKLKHLKAGDRLPNWDFTVNAISAQGIERKDVTLYQLLDPSSFTLFLLNCREAGLKSEEYSLLVKTWRVAGNCESFGKLFDTSAAFVLVRPDAYIGVAGKYEEISLVNEWMKKWII